MSRGKRAKKESNLWGIVLVLICVFVVGGTFYMLHDISKKVNNINTDDTENNNTVENIAQNQINENNTNEQNVSTDNNIIEAENTVVNEIDDTTNTVSNQAVNTSKDKTTPNTPAIPAVTDDKQKAIELVKQEWGEDDAVSFSFDYINEKGEYVVAVKDKSSATVKCYFRVNIQNGTVELD